MQQTLTLKLLPSEAENEYALRMRAAEVLGRDPENITGFHLLKKSIDARTRQAWVNITLTIFIDEPFIERVAKIIDFKKVDKAISTVIIVGAGPAGLFAALKCIEQGIKPIILERGKDVRSRRRDLAVLNKEGIVNADSNYCFG
ncbi:MAG: FAD-binding protein [Chitinophagaceae bacterium]